MKHEKIIELLREAGNFSPTFEFLEVFAKLVADKEREACAKHLDNQNTAMTDMLAAEIRARGEA